ncbi:MAG TPA: ATPase, T2SS/T4P/T4SS family [Gammaproteobacteria bacterium]|nr:ATPase, T2SS/T4P/T4SS family [Gammaproteobacteria bacterium]
MNAAVASSRELMRSRIGAITYLTPKDSLNDEKTVLALRNAGQACIAAGETRVVIELTHVRLVDGRALDAFLDLQDELLKIGGWLKLAHVNPLLQEIFLITGVSDYISYIDGPTGNSSVTLPVLPSKSGKFGDLLLARGLVTEEQIEEALRLQAERGERIGKIIVAKGWVSEQKLLVVLGEHLDIPVVDVRPGVFDPAAVRLLSKNVARRLCVLPLFKVRGTLYLATAKPQALPVLDEVAEHVRCVVRPVLAQREKILGAVDESLSGADFTADLINEVDEDFEVVDGLVQDDYSAIDEMAAGSPVVNLVNSVIQRAVQDGASDIHIEPSRTKSRIRYRIDGVLYEYMAPRSELHPSIVSRLKVMANLDIAERRMPQDGRIQVRTQGRSVDLRFSSLPGLYGEKIVLRVLDKNQAILDVHKLGMSAQNLSNFKELLAHHYGLILVTGPTGSGKTTSLYAAINYVNSLEKNIVTIEDPVEYQLDLINQNEVRANIGLTFAKVLKHVLRQDPDIIMVGEIRERETAEIAVQAALTGHLVLSTLHTNDSIGAVTRMIDMGVEPYLLSSALIGVVAQRLVRTVCESCKTSSLAPPEILERYGWTNEKQVRLFKGRGCPECYDSGYKGRMGIHETLRTDAALQRLIISNPGRDELTAFLKERKMKTLFDGGLDRVRAGLTTIEEVTRVIST